MSMKNVFWIWIIGILVYTSLNIIFKGWNSSITFQDSLFYVGWLLASIGFDLKLHRPKKNKLNTNYDFEKELIKNMLG